MKFSATQIAYHLTLTKGTVSDNGLVEFQTIPLIAITGLVFRLWQLSESIAPIVDRVNVWTKCLSIGFNSLTWAIA